MDYILVLKYKLFLNNRGVIITIGWQRDRDRIWTYSLSIPKTTLTNRVRGGDSRMKWVGGGVSCKVNTWTQLPWVGIRWLKQERFSGQWGHSSDRTLLFDIILWFWIDSVATSIFWFWGVSPRWAVTAATRFHQPG